MSHQLRRCATRVGLVVLTGACGNEADSLGGTDPARDAQVGPGDLADGADFGPIMDGGTETCGPELEPAPGRVRTTLGVVQGSEENGVWSYLGLRYARAPVGERRWSVPEAPACAETVIMADAVLPQCPQYDGMGQLVGAEDCLGLNLWSPVGEPDDRSRPVLVWIHGGGHEQGDGGRPIYGGAALARNRDVLVVTLNYRIGPFGFLSHPVLDAPGVPSGNYGMHDQLAALRWVQENARAFGGDPEQVMIFGQSAGSVSVCRLVASPAAAGLFSSAALHSGACVASPKTVADEKGESFLAGVGCQTEDCLRQTSTQEIMAGFEPSSSGTNVVGRLTFDGVVDGVLLPDAPRSLIGARTHNAVPILVGSTREENGLGAPNLQTEAAYQAAVRALYGGAGVPNAVIDRLLEIYPVDDYPSPRAAYVSLTSDLRFTCSARQDAELFRVSQEAPVYRYLFTHVPEEATPQLQAAGAWHGLDLFFIFGTLESASTLSAGPTDEATIAAMQAAWTALARGETPSPSSGPGPVFAWPEWNDEERLLILEDGAQIEVDPRSAQCRALAQLSGG
ncbi:MAG: carboxylesterase family protein [Myxococcota bacterium]